MADCWWIKSIPKPGRRPWSKIVEEPFSRKPVGESMWGVKADFCFSRTVGTQRYLPFAEKSGEMKDKLQAKVLIALICIWGWVPVLRHRTGTISNWNRRRWTFSHSSPACALTGPVHECTLTYDSTAITTDCLFDTNSTFHSPLHSTPEKISSQTRNCQCLQDQKRPCVNVYQTYLAMHRIDCFPVTQRTDEQ